MKNILKPTTTTYATKSQLLDYVTKYEFNEFAGEMKDFRDTTGHRLSEIDKRLNTIDKKIDGMKEYIRTTTGTYYEQLRDDLKAGLEYFQNVDAKKVDKEEFRKLEVRVQEIIDRK